MKERPTPTALDLQVNLGVVAVLADARLADEPAMVRLPDGTHFEVTRVTFDKNLGRVVLIVSDARERCPYTHSHTRAFCGYESCRES